MLRVRSTGASLALVLTLACGAPGSDEAPASSAPTVAVHTAKIRRMTLRRRVTGYGSVEPAPAGAGRPGGGSRLAAPVAGTVSEVLCEEGQPVEAGAPLFRLDRRVAKVDVAFAERRVARERTLLEVGGTSEQAVEDAERKLASARARMDLLEVRAPFAGRITRILVRPGEAVTPSRVLGILTNLERLVVAAQLPAEELTGLRVGAAARLLRPGSPPIPSSVTYVSPDVDPATGTARVRTAVPSDSGLRPGRFLRVDLVVEERRDRLAVPLAALVETTDGGAAVSIVEGDRARRVPVSRGLRDRGWVEIEGEGLAAGMSVVTEGSYGLPDETRVRVLTP